MKKVALITTNKILAQSLVAAMREMADSDFEFFILLDSKQALMDAEIFEIDIALIDLKETHLSFCELLHKKLPDAHLLLLVSQDDHARREIAGQAKKKGIVDDFVFYDASLKYLFAKLSSF